MTQRDDTDYSDQAETDSVQALAGVLGLQFPATAESGSEYNLVGIKSDSLLFSQRLDSRTYFVQDQEHGLLDAAGVFQGSERELIDAGEQILDSLGIPQDEVDTAVVLKEQLQGAAIDETGKVLYMEPIEEGAYHAWFTRKLDGIPVWDSRLMLSLTKTKSIGFMELHWPEIPDRIVREAHRLAYKIAQPSWQPPDYPGAEVQSVEAGIIHSPALGFFMDIYPVIRVIYRGRGEVAGTDPMVHLDRDGNRVPYPRQVELPVEVMRERGPQNQPQY
jgi:hypothetical protein